MPTIYEKILPSDRPRVIRLAAGCHRGRIGDSHESCDAQSIRSRIDILRSRWWEECSGGTRAKEERERVPLIFPTSEDRTSIIQRNAVIRSSPSVMVLCVFLAFHLSLPHALLRIYHPSAYTWPYVGAYIIRAGAHADSRTRIHTAASIGVSAPTRTRARMSPRFLRQRKHSRERTAVGGRRAEGEGGGGRGEGLGKERDRAGFSPGTHGG